MSLPKSCNKVQAEIMHFMVVTSGTLSIYVLQLPSTLRDITLVFSMQLKINPCLRPCSHWQIRIIRGEQKVPNFTACPLLIVGACSDWTKVALFPPVLPELATWERCTHCKIHVNIERMMFIFKLRIKLNCGVGSGRGCQLLPFPAVYWSVNILSRRPLTFNYLNSGNLWPRS